MTAINLVSTRMIDKGIAAARDLWTQFNDMVEGDTPPATAAAAFAAGTLVSTVPVPFLDVALGALVLRLSAGRLPRLPIVLAMALWNNLVMAPLYLATPRVGTFVLGLIAPDWVTGSGLALLPGILIGYGVIISLLVSFAYGAMRGGLALARGRATRGRPSPVRPVDRLRFGFTLDKATNAM